VGSRLPILVENSGCALLRDHGRTIERRAGERQARENLPEAWGNFLAALAAWDWFVTITFRSDPPAQDAALKRIGLWLADLQGQAGGKPIGWILAEEFGRVGGRYHCHLLITGVRHLQRRFWWSVAFNRFGCTSIEPFDPRKAAAFYAAKYAAKALGAIHPGGTLVGQELHCLKHAKDGRREWVDLSEPSSAPQATHVSVAPSASVPRTFYRLGLKRWHR